MHVLKPGISVVIPNYNGIGLLPEILPTVFNALQEQGLAHEVIVSDDCSTDASVSWLEAHYPMVHIIKNPVNRGFSPTINAGIFASQYAFILLLNSDVKLSRDYFSRLIPYMDDPDCFGVMGRIVGWDDDIMQDAAKYPKFHGAKIKTSGNYYMAEPGANDRLYSMYLSGANAFVSAEKIRMMGGFNELFAPYYVEDFELSLRAWRLGWACYYEHGAVCRHRLSVTIKSKSSKAAINTVYYRNKMFMHSIHLDGWLRVAWHLQLIPETMIRLLSGRLYYLRSLSYFFSHQNEVRKARQGFLALAIQTGRKYSVKDVVKRIHLSVSGKQIKRF